MSENEREQFVDKLLDAGLARYSAVEPRPGLEQRILAGLKQQPRPSLWLDWRWAGAFATAAVGVVVIVIFFFMRQPPVPTVPPQTATLPAPVAPATAAPSPEAVRPPAAKTTTRRATPRVEQARAQAPRLETFPAPAPLSEQERLLLLFTRQAPQEAVLMAQARNRPTEPLGVAPLQPIETLVKKTEENNN
ncbi:MAG: hypothetical protein ACRD5I_13435 [Candidatus Acidiferrales bacterium]